MLLKFFSAVCALCREIFRFPLLITHLRGKFHLGRARGQSASVLCIQPRQGWTSTGLSYLGCVLGRKVNPATSLQVNGQITQWLCEQLFADVFKTLPGQQGWQTPSALCKRSRATWLVACLFQKLPPFHTGEHLQESHRSQQCCFSLVLSGLLTARWGKSKIGLLVILLHINIPKACQETSNPLPDSGLRHCQSVSVSYLKLHHLKF